MSAWSYVLAGGRVVLQGPTAEVAGSPTLTDAFLGAAKSLV
jgi:ABC-type branched-subunit amino acid transport system ATPase component